jgi:hypothetical protein
MFWLDYTVEQGLNKFRVTGDWDKEVMGYDKNGNPGSRDRPLYSPGEVYIVREDGWLVKTDEVNALLLKHESSVQQQSQQPDQNT